MPTTMVLRFRDLVAPTIKAHQDLIDEHGYVWWGWWNKPSEKVPRHTFAEFKQVIEQSGSLTVYLVDSGHERLYRATLIGIDESDTETPKRCEEPERAPTYYSNSSFKAWFKFSRLEDESDDALRQWSYDEVEEFLQDPAAPRFNNKRVYSIQEMLNRRHRTIYFLQPYKPAEHQDYRVEFLLPMQPDNFMTDPIFRESEYILHVSDLHFSSVHHGFPLDATTGKTLAATVIEHLRRHYSRAPAAVMISGDLTWQGRDTEFDHAAHFVEDLKSAFQLEPQHFLIVPGNHDIQWADQEADGYDRTKPVRIGADRDLAERNYRAFYQKAFALEGTAFLSMGRRYVLANFVPIDIVGLNSCLLEQKHFAGYGYVSRDQLREAATAMQWVNQSHDTKYRVIVLHHHVVAVTPEEDFSTYEKNYSLTLDAGQLIYEALELEVDLIAHGHMHQPFSATVSRQARDNVSFRSRSLAVHATGSAGVKRDHTGPIGKNAFSVYNFDHEGVTVTVFAGSESANRFDEDWKCRFVRNPAGGLTPAPLEAGT